jgi:multicomponent K+:H+ antiporter subunit D
VTVPEHLVVVPVLLPLAAGAGMLLLDEQRVWLKAGIGLVATIALVVAAAALMRLVDVEGTQVYRLGDWAPPYGIVLVADRLAAALVLLAAVVGLASILFATARWHVAGPRFHALVQFLLMGVCGAFLTGDLFNLFVFFEVLLVASYALALHGSGVLRVAASLHYIAINLTASLLFLLGAALVYATAGTLNMADLAVRVPSLQGEDRALLETGAALLGVAFLAKAAMWPLGFWLPGTYAAASAPAAAMFTLLTKVGVYAILRTWHLLFADGAAPSAGFGGDVLLVGGMATLAFGTIGILAAQELNRLASYALVISAGTLLAATGIGDARVTGAALYYLVASTLATSGLFLLVELMERGRAPGAQLIAVTAEVFGEPEDAPEPAQVIGVSIPGTVAVLGLAFAGCALVIASLPPFAGFVGKFLMLDAMLALDPRPRAAWVLLALLLVSGLASILALARAGARRFWVAQDRTIPSVHLVEVLPVVALVALVGVMTVGAGEAMRYLDLAADALHAPRPYVERVLQP